MNPFAKNSNAHQTDVKQAQLKVDLIGLWHLKEINGQDKQSEKIFYNINCTEIKVLPYGDYKKYNNYNYILRNSNVYFGNGPYTVTIKNNEMTFSSLHFDCSITFKKVTVDQIQSILSKKIYLLNQSVTVCVFLMTTASKTLYQDISGKHMRICTATIPYHMT